MSAKPVTINSVEGLNAMPPGSVVQGADGDVYKRGASWWTVTFSSGSWPSSDIVLPATVLAPKPAEPVGDVVERVARAIAVQRFKDRGIDPYWVTDKDVEICGDMARAALSALPPSDAERKLAAVRERAEQWRFKGKGEPDDMPDEDDIVADRIACEILALLDGEVES